MKPEKQPNVVVNAIFGDNNQLNALSKISDDEPYQNYEVEKLKSDLRWALQQIRIRDVIIETYING